MGWCHGSGFGFWTESAAPEQANSSGPANATAKVEFHVEDVSPRQLAAMTSPGTKNVLLALYSPNLPKWQNFSSTLSQLAEHFSSNTSNFKVVKANCRDHPVCRRCSASVSRLSAARWLSSFVLDPARSL
jgi:thioredoxin-like negative regulator of GroEL